MVRKLSHVMTVISKSFYYLYFPEKTLGRLQYLTISSFLTEMSTRTFWQATANIKSNQIKSNQISALQIMHIKICNVTKENLCHCQYIIRCSTSGEDATLNCVMYKQREVLP